MPAGFALARPSAARAAAATALACALLTGLLGGCAYSGRRPAAEASAVRPLTDAEARSVVAHWQARLGRYVVDEGGGDPAVLARLPGLRSPAAPRPGRILFTVDDVFATAPERDGYDVTGQLVGKAPGAATPVYVFIVGTVERRDFRAAAVVDVRIAAMTVRDGVVSWDLGGADDAALARYRAGADASAAPRFPADLDRFGLVDCPQAICVEDIRSGARWTLGIGSTAAPSPGIRPGHRRDAGEAVV